MNRGVVKKFCRDCYTSTPHRIVVVTRTFLRVDKIFRRASILANRTVDRSYPVDVCIPCLKAGSGVVGGLV